MNISPDTNTFKQLKSLTELKPGSIFELITQPEYWPTYSACWKPGNLYILTNTQYQGEVGVGWAGPAEYEQRTIVDLASGKVRGLRVGHHVVERNDVKCSKA